MKLDVPGRRAGAPDGVGARAAGPSDEAVDVAQQRRVRQVVLGVVAVGAVLLLAYLLLPRDYYTGTNAVRTRGFLIELSKPGQKLCFPDVAVPGGTGRMELEIETENRRRPPMRFSMDVGGRAVSSSIPGGPRYRQKIQFAFPKTPESPAARTASPCIEATGKGKAFFGGVPGVAPGEKSPTLDGKDVDTRAAIWWRPPAGEKASILFNLPEQFRRMALFKPSWTGAWTFWVLFLVIAPAIALLALRTLLHPRRRRIPLAIAIGLIGFANAAVWAHVTPAFNAPDESEHFAYTQSLVERGKPLERVPTERSTYSSQEALGIRSTRILDGNETPDGKPPWLKREQDVYERLDRQENPPPDDGGGFAAAGSSHSPTYYALTAPAYLAARGGGLFDSLVAVRLVSALLGGLVAACAFMLVLELLPGRRRIAVAAGLAVAFQPMFAFMAGSVNNDMGVNAGAAVVLLLTIRLIRRGFSIPLGLGLGVALALTPLLKATGFGVYPAAVLGVLLAVLVHRREWRSWVPGVVCIVLGFAAIWLTWKNVSAQLDRGTFGTPTGGAPGEGFAALQEKGPALVYIWEIFLPALPGMAEHWTQSWPAFDIYGLRGWGAFGWYAVKWPHIVYWVIMVLMLGLTALGLVALWRRRSWTLPHIPQLLVLVTLIGGVIGVMTAAYYSRVPQGEAFPIQGRYLFPAITALAAVFFGSAYAGAGRRWGEPAAAGLSAAVVCLGYASLWLVLSGFYFSAV